MHLPRLRCLHGAHLCSDFDPIRKVKEHGWIDKPKDLFLVELVNECGDEGLWSMSVEPPRPNVLFCCDQQQLVCSAGSNLRDVDTVRSHLQSHRAFKASCPCERWIQGHFPGLYHWRF